MSSTEPVDDTTRRLNALAEGGVFSGFVKEDFVRMCAPYSSRPCLMTGVPPAVGQRLEISITPAQVQNWFRISGSVTSVDHTPVPGVPCPALSCGCGEVAHTEQFGAATSPK